MTANAKDLVPAICAEIGAATGAVSAAERQSAIDAIAAANRIFVAGEGRSGLVLRMAAMRLVHLGMIVHVVGDATTPAIGPGDLLIAGSGSGETPITLLVAESARLAGATLMAVTARAGSRLETLAHTRLILPTPAKGDQTGSIQPGGTLFEQSMLVVFDSLFLEIAGDSAATRIEQRHANME